MRALPGGPVDDSRARPHSWQVEHPGPERGDVGMRARDGRGASSGPGRPDDSGARSPEAGTDSLPFPIRPPRRPGPSGIAARKRVILSDHDLAVIRKAVTRARHDGEDYRQDAADGRHGTGPDPDPPASEFRETRPL